MNSCVGNRRRCLGLLQADDLGVPLAMLFQDILLRAQDEVGHRWQRGDLRVGQEHEITEIVREAIAQLTWRHAAEPQGPPLLAACAPGEHHDLGLRMVVGLLRAHGRDVHFLGTNIDVPILLEEIRTRLPAIVLPFREAPSALPCPAIPPGGTPPRSTNGWHSGGGGRRHRTHPGRDPDTARRHSDQGYRPHVRRGHDHATQQATTRTSCQRRGKDGTLMATNQPTFDRGRPNANSQMVLQVSSLHVPRPHR